MLNFTLRRNDPLQRVLANEATAGFVEVHSPEEKTRILIVRDLLRLGWEMTSQRGLVTIRPPDSYDKQIVKDSMQIKRQESISAHRKWINKHIDLARVNLANGLEAFKSEIQPEIETCETQEQLDTFRIFRFYWSSPYSEYVGRRIKLIIRDAAIPSRPIIGIAALGSSIVHIPERDAWIGWDTKTRTQNLVYAMDAYVLGALPPYNHLLGGKLISCVVASNEIRKIFKKKYKDQITNISRRSASDLVCIFTTSLYGKSSQYNRLKYHDELLYVPIGQTKGYGTLHLTDETFNSMRDLLVAKGINVTNRFGDGPIWRMRVIRTAADILGFDADFLLRHSFKREIYGVPLAKNFKSFLNGEAKRADYYDYPIADLTNHWRNRWLHNRKKREEVKAQVVSFNPSSFRVV